VGSPDEGFPYSSFRDIVDDALRHHLKEVKKQYPKLVKRKGDKK